MSNQSMSLGQYWNDFIDKKIAEGRYLSASEVVRDALRLLEETEDDKLVNLKRLLVEGENSGYVDFNIDDIIKTAKKQRKNKK